MIVTGAGSVSLHCSMDAGQRVFPAGKSRLCESKSNGDRSDDKRQLVRRSPGEDGKTEIRTQVCPPVKLAYMANSFDNIDDLCARLGESRSGAGKRRREKLVHLFRKQNAAKGAA